MLFWLCVLLSALGVALSGFKKLVSCDAYPGTAVIVCNGQVIDLTDTVIDSSTSKGRIFVYESDANEGYYYVFVIPMMANKNPSFPSQYTSSSFNPTPSFSSSAVWQVNTPLTMDAYLGSYDSGSWEYGLYGGVHAFSASFVNGQTCPFKDYKRQVTLYLMCRAGYSASAPLITVDETVTCIYEITMAYSEVCAFSESVPVPTKSPSASSSSGTGADTTAVTTVVVLFVIAGAIFVTCRRCGCLEYSLTSSASVAPAESYSRYATSPYDDLDQRPAVSGSNSSRFVLNQERERQRRLSRLREQLTTVEDGCAPSNGTFAVPTAAVVYATAYPQYDEDDIPTATVITVDGVSVGSNTPPNNYRR